MRRALAAVVLAALRAMSCVLALAADGHDHCARWALTAGWTVLRADTRVRAWRGGR